MILIRHKAIGLAGIIAACLVSANATHAAPIFEEDEIRIEVLNPNLEGTYRAILRTPPQNEKSHIGIFVMHAFGGSTDNHVCNGLAVRGYTMLCADTEFMGREGSYKGYEDHAPAIAAGVSHLRKNTPGIMTVLLYGRSMGAPMMSFYANVQENGVGVCQDPRRIIACGTENLLDEAEIGLQQISELLPVEGTDYIGPHPEDLQIVTLFSAGVTTSAENAEGAMRLLDYLSSREVAHIIATMGLDPVADD